MSALFKQAERQERERFFWRLDSQWGKGLKKVTTHPDRCPDFRIVTKPNIAHDWAVWSADARALVYSGTKRECRNWLLAQLTLWPLIHLELRSLQQRSKQTAPIDLPRTYETRLHCDAQTLVTPRREKPMSVVTQAALGTFSDAPSASGLVPDFSGDADMQLAPYRIVDGKKVWLP